MTGYAVTFNKRHKRSGHLFQNRYKSVVCEEETYLLELIRYIHLNPLRAGLVADLKELDKYPWTGHSAILGKKKNPLIPKKPVSKQNHRTKTTHHKDQISHNKFERTGNSSENASEEKSEYLATKTVEDVLLYFGNNLSVCRKSYRHFVKNGVDQGSRSEFHGGGLVRSAGGNKASLLGLQKDEREPFDQRVLGSGVFVTNVLKEENEKYETRAKYNLSLGDLINRVCSKYDVEERELISRSRKRQISKARAVICYLAVNELGITGVRIGRSLKISGKGVSNCVERGQVVVNKSSIIEDIFQ